jgi:hypothetical protein
VSRDQFGCSNHRAPAPAGSTSPNDSKPLRSRRCLRTPASASWPSAAPAQPVRCSAFFPSLTPRHAAPDPRPHDFPFRLGLSGPPGRPNKTQPPLVQHSDLVSSGLCSPKQNEPTRPDQKETATANGRFRYGVG